MSDNTCILDNGGYLAKVGLSTQKVAKLVPNCIMKAKSERRRAFIGKQIEDCRDLSGLFYLLSFQKGYLVNWDTQKAVWDHIFSPECTSINLCDKSLVFTEPQFNFQSIQEAVTEIFFEEYECEALFRTTATDLCFFNYTRLKSPPVTSCIIIDMGYSFVHIVPYIDQKKVKAGIRRIDIGGKVLTNHLKELISYRHLNVMDESYVVNQIKEDICYVSTNFKNDMQISSKRSADNTIVQDYVLPDFTTIKRGYVREGENSNTEQQSIRLSNERFTVPELLFYPSDVGINQMGISEAVLHSLKDCPTVYHHLLYANIVVVGGCALFPGLGNRLQAEIRALAPDEFSVNVIITDNPITYAWEGGKYISSSSSFVELTTSREEYEEQGFRASMEKSDL